MSALWGVMLRELASFFRTPVGWLACAIFVFLSSLFVAPQSLTPGEPATLRNFFAIAHWLLLFVAPALSMRLIAEERRSGTAETLMTSPASDWAVVFGKYLAACAFLLIMLVPTLAFPLALEFASDPDYGPVLSGYLGLVLTGFLYLAVGLLFSSMTSSQVIAFLGTLLFFVALAFVSRQGAAWAPEPLGALLGALSIDVRLADFARGVIDTRHIVFFLALSVWFVSLAVVPLELRRWR
ncbi:MAG: gliding motility-associated ABC transporter permease subunit GldF [Phycisphaerales bacterium]